MRTSQVPRNISLSIHITCFLFFFSQPNKSHSHVLLTSKLAANYQFIPCWFLSPLCTCTIPTQQGDTSNTLLCSDWSDNERGLLLLADQFKFSKLKLNFRWKERPTT